MGKFKPYDREQTYLFPLTLDEFIKDDHLARVIDEIIEGFDTTNIEKKYSYLGQKSYHPKILLKILFYGYSIGIRSGRKLSTECESDTAFMFLSCMQTPDFRTINDFRKDNIKEIESYFLEVLKICQNLGMIKVGELYIDSTKIRANASVKRTKDKAGYEKWLAQVEEKIKEILKEVEEIDAKEDTIYGEKRGDELPKKLQSKEVLKEKISSLIQEMDDKKKVNLTDKDAKNIKSGGVIKPNYNCHASVTEDEIIVASNVSNNASDSGELINILDQAESNTQKDFNEPIADSGYGTYDNYEELERRGKNVYMPDQAYAKEQKRKYKDKLNLYDKSNFIYNKDKDVFICPKGKVLIYKGKSCEDSRRYKVYKGIECGNCKVKNLCTKAKSRIIKREEREEIRERAITRLKTAEGQVKYNKRGYKIEPKFGHIKFNLKYFMFHLRGKEKVNGEFKLICTVSNIWKIYQFRSRLNKAA